MVVDFLLLAPPWCFSVEVSILAQQGGECLLWVLSASGAPISPPCLAYLAYLAYLAWSTERAFDSEEE